MTAGTPGVKDAAAPKPQRPRDASTLIIVDRSRPAPRVLMGRRRMEQVFMPGKYVFPGGRVDKTDCLVTSADELPASETGKLMMRMKGAASPVRARALALAAIRETFEEAGLVIGAPLAQARSAGVPGWDEFFASGYMPMLSPLTFFARAITPPGRTRRYDTRFFHMDAAAIAHRTDSNDGELSGLHWLTMDETREFDLSSITRVVLEDLMERIDTESLNTGTGKVPFYHFSKGSFRRDILASDLPQP